MVAITTILSAAAAVQSLLTSSPACDTIPSLTVQHTDVVSHSKTYEPILKDENAPIRPDSKIIEADGTIALAVPAAAVSPDAAIAEQHPLDCDAVCLQGGMREKRELPVADQLPTPVESISKRDHITTWRRPILSTETTSAQSSLSTHMTPHTVTHPHGPMTTLPEGLRGPYLPRTSTIFWSHLQRDRVPTSTSNLPHPPPMVPEWNTPVSAIANLEPSLVWCKGPKCPDTAMPTTQMPSQTTFRTIVQHHPITFTDDRPPPPRLPSHPTTSPSQTVTSFSHYEPTERERKVTAKCMKECKQDGMCFEKCYVEGMAFGYRVSIPTGTSSVLPSNHARVGELWAHFCDMECRHVGTSLEPIPRPTEGRPLNEKCFSDCIMEAVPTKTGSKIARVPISPSITITSTASVTTTAGMKDLGREIFEKCSAQCKDKHNMCIPDCIKTEVHSMWPFHSKTANSNTSTTVPRKTESKIARISLTASVIITSTAPLPTTTSIFDLGVHDLKNCPAVCKDEHGHCRLACVGELVQSMMSSYLKSTRSKTATAASSTISTTPLLPPHIIKTPPTIATPTPRIMPRFEQAETHPISTRSPSVSTILSTIQTSPPQRPLSGNQTKNHTDATKISSTTEPMLTIQTSIPPGPFTTHRENNLNVVLETSSTTELIYTIETSPPHPPMTTSQVI